MAAPFSLTRYLSLRFWERRNKVTGDFNAEELEAAFETFLYHHNLKNLVKGGTFFKNLEQPSCIDLFLTNSPLSFQHTISVFKGLSDFHK